MLVMFICKPLWIGVSKWPTVSVISSEHVFMAEVILGLNYTFHLCGKQIFCEYFVYTTWLPSWKLWIYHNLSLFEHPDHFNTATQTQPVCEFETGLSVCWPMEDMGNVQETWVKVIILCIYACMQLHVVTVLAQKWHTTALRLLRTVTCSLNANQKLHNAEPILLTV